MSAQFHHRKVGTDTHLWDVHRLIDLSKSLDPIEIALNEIAELDEHWWRDDATRVDTPRRLAQHLIQVRDVDLKYPIILCAEGRLMDGMHRVIKALTQGHKTIKAVRFKVTPEPDYVNIDISELSGKGR